MKRAEAKRAELSSKPLPAPPKEAHEAKGGRLGAGASAPSRDAMQAQRKPARAASQGGGLKRSETVATLAHRHALRRQTRSARRGGSGDDAADVDAAAAAADADAAITASPRAPAKEAKEAKGAKPGGRRRGKKPGLSITIADSNSRTPREDDGEPAGAAAAGADDDTPKLCKAGDGGDPAVAMGQSYAVTESGTINIRGFEIRETGIARAPAGAGGGGGVAGGESVSGSGSVQDLKRDICKMSVLGRGASGTVYKALHVPSLRLVAMKVIPMFETEKRHQMIAELQTLYNNIIPLARGEPVSPDSCPHIVGFYDAFSSMDDGNMSIVVEFMDGGSLQDIVDTGGCASESVLANISFRVLSGLAYIHDQRQLHRDIKPSNLLINHSGEVKISDFGTTRDLESSLAQANTFVGTLTYMSPERISGDPYSFASDVWSFGLSIMTCALGEFPLDISGGYWSLVHTLRDEPSPELPPDSDEAEWSAEFRDFLAQTLRKDPVDRPSARELLRHPFLAGCAEIVAADAAAGDDDLADADDDGTGGSETARSELDEVAEHLFDHYRQSWALPRFSMAQLQGLARQLGVAPHVVRAGLESHLRRYLADRQAAGVGTPPGSK